MRLVRLVHFHKDSNMNLYITDSRLTRCATNLDNKRLPLQLQYAQQIVSNVMRINKNDYKYILDEFSVVMGWQCDNNYENWLLPERDMEHSATEWAAKSPVNFLLVIKFCYHLYGEKNNRHFGINFRESNFDKLVRHINPRLSNIVPQANRDNLFGLEDCLYRNLPPTVKEEDTMTAYQQHLIAQWKQDIIGIVNNQAIYQAWKEAGADKTSKPRLTRLLKWGTKHAFPDFAKEELTAFREGLINANTKP